MKAPAVLRTGSTPLLLYVLLSLAACGPFGLRVDGTSTPDGVASLNAVVTDNGRVNTQAGATPTPPPTSATPPPSTSLPSTPVPTATLLPTATPVPPTTTPSATYRPGRTPTATPESPVTLSFTADRTQVQPGEKVTLTWTSSAGVTARLYRYEQFIYRDTQWPDLPPNGSLAVEINGAERDEYQFQLLVYNGGGAAAFSQPITIHLPCTDTYFFTLPDVWKGTGGDVCPAGPAIHSPVAEEPFQGGRMIWVQSQAAIYVLYGGNAGVYQKFMDTWVAGEPESDPTITPPEGLYQPERGFGKVWRNELVVRQELSWALAPERSYETLYQQAWVTCSGGCGGPGNIYLRTNDGRIINLSIEQSHGGLVWASVTP